MIMPDGRLRHSVYFSIIASDWPAVKTHLERLLLAYPSKPADLGTTGDSSTPSHHHHHQSPRL
jgi:hypothetical protein